MTGVFLVFMFVFAQSISGATEDTFYAEVKLAHMAMKCEQKVCRQCINLQFIPR